ncbi:YdaU family protein, partial [Bartonella birtlesii]
MKQDHQQIAPYYESCRLPYVCWYQNDFLGGVRGMRAHEIGIYTILLNEMYARGRPLELSVERLARLCGCDKRTFTNVLEMLIEEGKILNLAHGLWNKRCEAIFQERAKFLEQKSFAGQCSAKKRKEINATLQQLLNTPARDDEQNSQAQKREEKETPNGVSQKPLFLITTEPFANASIQAPHACSTPRIPSSSNMGNQNSIPVADDQPANKASIGAQTDKASIGAQTDKASIGAQTDKASIDAQTDKASIGAQTDKASIGAQTDKASIGTQTDKASIGTQTNKASIGAQTNKASIGTQTNKASIGTQTDKASIGTQTDKASIGAQTDKASIGAQTDKASIGAQTDKAS